jgi:hypothetical protein
MAAYAAVRRRTITEQNETDLLTSSLLHGHGNVPADRVDDGAPGLFLPAYCQIPVQATLAYVNQPEGFVSSEGYHVVVGQVAQSV